MKCLIVPEKCIACGLCQIVAPEIFDYDDDGIVLFKQEPEAQQQFIAEAARPALLEAYRKCPVRAILIEK
ncbi:ferredoxin [Enterococcus sp. LJL120]|uniref:ferredoxin n=1 Tax=Enterococcus sp. HY326 TaxID=2971265 RepID=UPI00223F0CCF|nr:ferredoxin [Enterococcus sp. HY326]